MDEARSYFDATTGATQDISNNLRRRGVLAVALVTYRYTGADAEDFWHQVAWDDGLGKDDPRKKLHNYIRYTPNKGHAPHIVSYYVAAAWNAAFADPIRPIRSLQVHNLGNPLRLDGTPHNGKEMLRYISPEGEILHDPVAYQAGSWDQKLFATEHNGTRASHDHE